MSEWKTIKLQDCCMSIIDGDHQSMPLSETGIPFIVISDIKANQIDFTNARHVPQSYFDSLDRTRKPQSGDIIYSVKGSFGIPAYVKTDAPFTFQRDIALLKCNNNIDSRYLFHVMRSDLFYRSADLLAIGSAQRALTLKTLRNMRIPFPSISVQRKIADILSAYDNLIENNQKQIKLLEEAAQRLYQEWFVKLRFPGHEKVKIVDGVPEGWKRKNVGDVSSLLRRGISPKYNEGGRYQVINQKCIRQAIMDISLARKQEKVFSAEMNLQDSDTVICSTGAGTLGRVGQVFGDYSSTTFDSHITLVRADDGMGKEYLFHSLKSAENYLQNMGKGSTNQLELSRDTISSIAGFKYLY